MVIEADEFKMKVTQRHLAPCFSAVFCPFSAVFLPLFRAFRLPGAKTERMGGKWRNMGANGQDVFFRELNKLTGGDNEVAAMVHGASTEAANKQLIAALSSGRDVVLDGTMTWRPFVEQTIRTCSAQ